MAPSLNEKKCCRKPPSLKVTKPRDVPQRIDVKICRKIEPPHPCDPQLPCDPFSKKPCVKPFICSEKIKNPALPGEITRCQPGAFINAKRCAKVEPPHPCDPLPVCNPAAPKRDCDDPALCEERIKNRELPNGRKIVVACIPPENQGKASEKTGNH